MKLSLHRFGRLALGCFLVSLVLLSSGCGSRGITTAKVDETPNKAVTKFLLTRQDVASTGVKLSNIRHKPHTITKRSYAKASHRFNMLDLGILSVELAQYNKLKDRDAAFARPIPVPAEATNEQLSQQAGDKSTYVKIEETAPKVRHTYHIRFVSADVVADLQLKVNPEKATLPDYEIANLLVSLAKQMDEKIRVEKLKAL